MGDTSVVSRVGSIRERSRGVGAHQESILVDDRRGEDAGLGVGEEIERLAARRVHAQRFDLPPLSKLSDQVAHRDARQQRACSCEEVENRATELRIGAVVTRRGGLKLAVLLVDVLTVRLGRGNDLHGAYRECGGEQRREPLHVHGNSRIPSYIGRLEDAFEKFVFSHFTGREGGMTTVWRPRVRIPVPDIDGADADENRRDELTTKGTKRKRAPRTKGPCEHGVKTARTCKVCSACPHGRRRSQCKECGGSGICEHGRRAHSVQGVRWGIRYASTVVGALGARSAVGHRYASTVVSALSARSAVGHQYASTVVCATECKECGGASICEHGRRRSQCKECGGSQICEHGRRRSDCKECKK